MENARFISTTRVGLKYGIFTGVASLGYSVLVALLRLQDDLLLNLLSIGIFIAGIVYGILEYKRANEQYISYGQGLEIGTVVSVISGLIGAFASLIYYTLISKDALSQAKQELITLYEKQGYTDEQIDLLMPWIDRFTSPGGIFILGVLGSLFLGFLLTLVIAAFMKNDRPMFE